jgi:DNA-binding NarL/FixJ family response regulator
VFAIVSNRPEFVGEWTGVLSARGKVATWPNIDALLAVIARSPGSRLAIFDFVLLEGSPVSRLQEICRRCGETRLLLAGAEFPPQRELAGLAAGAAACCDGNLPRTDVERVVDTVLQGGVWISRSAIPLLVTKLQAAAQPESGMVAEAPGDPLDGLTQRQREVAELVGQGASNKQIARTLDITDRTVKAHLTTIFEKLKVADRLQLALYVTRQKAGG